MGLSRNQIKTILMTKYDMDEAGSEVLCNAIEKQNNKIVEVDGMLYIKNNAGLLTPVIRSTDLSSLITQLKDICSHGITINQSHGASLNYLYEKIKLLEADKCKSTPEIIQEKEQEKVFVVDKKKDLDNNKNLVNKSKDYKFYQTICESIARDNQYYHLILINKNTLEYSNYAHTRYQKHFDIFGNRIGKVCEIASKFEDLLDRMLIHANFILYEDTSNFIFIKGITEPNVYAVIEQLKVDYRIGE